MLATVTDFAVCTLRQACYTVSSRTLSHQYTSYTRSTLSLFLVFLDTTSDQICSIS